MKYPLKLICLLLCVSGLWACAKKRTIIPDGVIGIEKFAEILTDIRLAESSLKLQRVEGRTIHKQDSVYFLIYRQHGVSGSDVESSFEWYARHPEVMVKLDQMVLEKLNRLQ